MFKNENDKFVEFLLGNIIRLLFAKISSGFLYNVCIYYLSFCVPIICMPLNVNFQDSQIFVFDCSVHFWCRSVARPDGHPSRI